MKAAPTTSIPLLRYLESFSLKITHGIMQPQLTLSPTMEDRLGLAVPTTPQQSPQELFALWCTNPERITPPQMEIINQYRYENSMMDPVQESEYESWLLSSRS